MSEKTSCKEIGLDGNMKIYLNFLSQIKIWQVYCEGSQSDPFTGEFLRFLLPSNIMIWKNNVLVHWELYGNDNSFQQKLICLLSFIILKFYYASWQHFSIQKHSISCFLSTTDRNFLEWVSYFIVFIYLKERDLFRMGLESVFCPWLYSGEFRFPTTYFLTGLYGIHFKLSGPSTFYSHYCPHVQKMDVWHERRQKELKEKKM